MPALLPFQEKSRAWLAHRLAAARSAFFWSETGTGKTPVMIAVADDLDVDMRLVCCPAIARINWYREITKWQADPLMPVFVVGIDGDVPPDTFKRGWVIVNYERVRNGQPKLLYWLKRPWGIALLDEHQYLANSESQRTSHFYNGNPSQGGRLAPWFAKCVLASGTPFRNSYADGWPHFIIWTPDAIGKMDEEAFKDHFTHRVMKRLPSNIEVEQITGSKNGDELMQRLDGTYVRYRRTDPEVFRQMPQLVVGPWWLPVSGRAKELSDQLADLLQVDPFDTEDEIAYTLENAEEHGNSIHGALEAIGLLHAEYVADLVSDIVLMPKAKVLLFAHNKSVMDSLMEKLQHLDLRPVEIRGGQDAKTRQLGIDVFQSDASCRAAVVQLQVGSTAVTLTAATDIIFVQMDWTATNNSQCIARAYGRVNDPHPVMARIIMSDDWLGKGQARVIAKRLSSIHAALPGTIEHAIDAALNGHVSMDLPPVSDDWAA